jgi:hypothetical protein
LRWFRYRLANIGAQRLRVPLAPSFSSSTNISRQ